MKAKAPNTQESEDTAQEEERLWESQIHQA